MNEITLEQHLKFHLPPSMEISSPPLWPPDVFGLTASLLHLSGGYCVVSCNWPPRKHWDLEVKTFGKSWRRSFLTKAPARVIVLWEVILTAKDVPVSKLPKYPKVCAALVELLAIADEASVAIGIPFVFSSRDAFDSKADLLLANSNAKGGANLCSEVRAGSFLVLPKMHVPQSGFTLRSFSQHLAFVANTEINPFWHIAGSAPGMDETLDLLLLPWPMKLSKKNFRVVNADQATMKNLADGFGFFHFEHENTESLAGEVLRYVQVAQAEGDVKIDAVVMPELSLSNGEYENISSLLFNQGIYLIAGVGGERNADGTTGNSVRFNVPLFHHNIPIRQSKHHRWKLEETQIRNYGLSLPEKMQLWEHIPVKDRSLTFICLRRWLALCVLICEDLARPDPVGELLRAVGPNLVIALLLDGPQLEGRWSGRYATTLADDPGSSVLTLTCAGMTGLSNPPNSRSPQKNHGKVALWKDVRGKTHEINLFSGEAALLHVQVEEREAWTADGRGSASSGYPLLKSVRIFRNYRKAREYNV